MVNVSFWGVRGSTPCSCDANRRYGGNTSCVTVEAPDLDPIIFDLGTGLRFFGESLDLAEPLRALALVTHLHWDHVQGLPFFPPIHRPGSSLTVYGRADEATLDEAFRSFMKPPYFPIGPDDLIGDVKFVDVGDGDSISWGRAEIEVSDVPHTGATNGYRVEVDGVVIAYVSDHQQPPGSVEEAEVAESVIELCRGADLLIHDAQYEPHEFEAKAHWGHCTVEYAVRVAELAGVRRLALFHHDPSHGDPVVDRMLAEARTLAEGTGVEEVVAAHEGLTICLDPAVVSGS